MRSIFHKQKSLPPSGDSPSVPSKNEVSPQGIDWQNKKRKVDYQGILVEVALKNTEI